MIRKNLDLEEAGRNVQHALRLGIKVTVSYIIGFPRETEEDVEKTLKSLLEMAMAGAEPQMALLSILPGTAMYMQYVDQLEYDGKTFGMTGSFLNRPVINMVKTDQKLFSSFYYVPCKFLRREDLVFVSNMVNLLFLFLPTLKVLKKYLKEDIANFPVYRYIIRMSSVYRNNRSASFPELFCLSDTIRKYLGYLASKGLQEYMLDIFKVDLTRAYMQVKYNNWQYLRAGKGLPADCKKISDHYQIRILPFWKIISVKYDIRDYVNNPVQDFHGEDLQKGNYHYLILPVSENQTRLFEVSEKHLILMKKLTDTSVFEFLEKSENIAERDEARQFLRKMANLGMIEIKTPG
jgi:hypothetical protein